MSTIETPITLRLTESARMKLAEQAARSGRDISSVASEFVERAVTRPSFADIMEPVWEQTAESQMTDGELDDFLRGEIEAHRREAKAKSS